MADQPTNGALVARAGAGLVVVRQGDDHGDGAGPSVDAARIHAALRQILSNASYRRAARTIADDMRAMPVIDTRLAELARGHANERARERGP